MSGAKRLPTTNDIIDALAASSIAGMSASTDPVVISKIVNSPQTRGRDNTTVGSTGNTASGGGDNLSLLANFLIKRACNSPKLANSLYWFLKV